jgi:rubrerythrin
MKSLFSAEKALDIAIAGEIDAYKSYIEMAAMAEDAWLREAIEALAREELEHRKKLEAVKSGKAALEYGEVVELQPDQIPEAGKPKPDMTFRDLLAFAIKKENTSCRLYNRLADVFAEPRIKDIFRKLAKEEAEHRRRFELQYAETTQ